MRVRDWPAQPGTWWLVWLAAARTFGDSLSRLMLGEYAPFLYNQ
jgi:hypothetical protein